MAHRKGVAADAGILATDVDDTTNQEVESEQAQVTVSSTEPGDAADEFMPTDSGKSFSTVVATFVVGIILTFLIGKGYLTAQSAQQYTPLLQGVILAGIGFVAHRFIKTRGEVKVAAIRAASTAPKGGMIAGESLHPLGASQMGGFGGLQGVLMALSSAQLIIGFLPGSKAKKAVVQKSIASAIAAITAFQQSPN